ncbi:glycoside hydrolase family 88 protein [Bacillus sp. FJAT-42376]|uniref:glycoside hydrolase family 88 protein n=1 Tax=Bacillus sp. FJAT-42376 TaxID=2014076 RepID=UPI001F14EE5C|nr:glycoside hydrolase family 88 protein [Bacillus sp. FJAT-42376]
MDVVNEGIKIDRYKTSPRKPDFADRALDDALEKISANLELFTDIFPDDTTIENRYYPRKPEKAGQVRGGNFGWTTSFWTGMIWLAYEVTGEEKYKKAADIHVNSFYDRIVKKIDCEHHDLGFLYTLSCVSGYKLTGNQKAKEAALMAADHLMTRYFEKAGIIQAWGDLSDPNQRGRIIIDCLMNLPLLYWASEETGNPRYKEAAEKHAKNAYQWIVREDASTYHTYFFDTETGEAKFGKTHQGYRDDSCWARGQAWGIYGFPLSYKYTSEKAFIAMTEKLAHYFLNRTPADGVVYWDLAFTDGSGEEKDSSSTAIAACGLHELAKYTEDPGLKNYYGQAAACMLRDLYEGYSTKDLPESNALLLHGVYAKPEGLGVDEACLWGDYYYMEGLVRLKKDWDLYW